MKKSICFLLVLIMVIGCSSFVFADQKESKGEEYTIGEAYVYPIVPGTNEWNNFDTVFEMIDACQIPEDVLKSMTTEALAKTVLNYPLLMDLIAGSTAREGFESMLSNFNGFQELSKRPEASSYLGNEYLELSNNNSQTKSYDAEQQLKENLTGILLQQPEFGGELVLSQISPKATPPQYEYVTLVTAKGNSIQIKNCTLDYDKEQLNYMNSEYDKMYPKATRLSSATAKQNCHAYAFLGKGGMRWIDTAPAKILMKDNYKSLSSNKAGFSIYYDGGAHSAITVTTNSTLTNTVVDSKWGPYGAYEHKLTYCPSVYVPSGVKYTFWGY